MNKIFKILTVFIVALSVVGCSNTNESEESSTNAVVNESESIEETTIIEEESDPIEETTISDQDYNKYNYIMDYLDKYPDTSEDELFKELGSYYGESPDELISFMNSNMQDAINRDSQK